ncbi:Crp/Fnr family transcriptional regulator [Derxia lacustris]|uniref:Crp/Fnr family transcriptional regulator n=1 Tax=Derxia lacustris TaxID=764842 RepID=UPI000A16FE56|nr:Crp/Fnr family transcriptional regulator [Derxia lacustris]
MTSAHPHAAPGSGGASPPSLLHLLDSPEGAAFLADFRPRDCARGELISRPGDGSDSVFVVRSGRVRVYLADELREVTLAFLEPGDVFSTHTPTFVMAVQPSRLALIDTRRFSARVAGYPPATVAIMRVLGKLLARTVELVENLVFLEAHERLANFLATLARRQGRRAPADATEAPETWIVPLPFTLTDIALMLGASRQTISSAFGELERDGIVERRGRRELRVLDLARLDARGRRETSSARQTSGPRRT